MGMADLSDSELVLLTPHAALDLALLPVARSVRGPEVASSAKVIFSAGGGPTNGDAAGRTLEPEALDCPVFWLA